MDTVSLSLYDEFPCLSLKLSNGYIKSNRFEDDSLNLLYGGIVPDDAIDLLKFDKLVVSVNIPELLFGKINVKGVQLDGTDIYAYISPWGKANWDIFGEESSTDEQEGSSNPLNFNVNRISVNNTHLIFDDSEKQNSFEATIGDFYANGKISLDFNKLSVEKIMVDNSDLVLYMEESQSLAEVHIDSIHFVSIGDDIYDIALASNSNLMMESKVYTTDFPFSIYGKVGFEFTDLANYQVDSTVISLAGSSVLLDGRVSLREESIFTNLYCAIPKLDFGKVLPFLNTEAFPELEGMTTNLTASLSAEVVGRYEMESGRFPAIKADLKIPKGNLHYPGIDVDVDRLQFDGFINYDPYNEDSTTVTINDLNIVATGLVLEGKGKGIDMIRDPNLDLKIKGSADITKLSRIFLKDSGITADGDMSINMLANFKLSDLNINNIGNTRFFGNFKSDDLLINIPQDSIYAMMRGVSLNFGSYVNKRDTLFGEGIKTLRLAFQTDTSDVNYKDEMLINLSKAKAEVKLAAEGLNGDTTEVHPLRGNLEAERIRVATADSTRLSGRKMKLKLDLLPSKDDPTVPMIACDVNADRLMYRDIENWVSLRKGSVDMNCTTSEYALKKRRNDADRQLRMNKRLDSLQIIYPNIVRDSLLAYSRRNRDVKDEFGEEGNIDMSMDKSIVNLMQKWDINCSVKAGSGRITTPYFPLRNSLSNINLSFTTNEIRFNETRIQSGKSDLELTGRIWGIKRAVTNKGKIRADLKIASDTLDFNELLNAYDASSAYMASSEAFKDSISSLQSEEDIQKKLAESVDTVKKSDLIIIPGNIDIKLGLLVGYGEFSNIVLDEISGEVIAKDRCLQINNLSAITEAGDLSLTALYATKSREDISTGFDLELKDVQVEKLINVIPQVDTLLPMLRSFQGLLNCQMAATASIDTSMNIILPSLCGVGRINGKNLVLLDGKTFAEIAKMLKFKNRENNLIDSISVEMIVQDNVVELFPFIMQMDRYQAAISGFQNLDMSFKYHISVLKSPLPMKLGINIFGDFDNMKFRLCKPKYKNASLPVYSQIIDASRMNLIKGIDEIFKKGIDKRTIAEVSVVPVDSSVALREDLIVSTEQLSAADSLSLRKEGIIPRPSANEGDTSEPPVSPSGNTTPLLEPSALREDHLW